MTRGTRIAQAARGAVGTRFRLHGRDVAQGLDCVGLVALAVRAGGYAGAVPTGYALRGGAMPDMPGFRRVRRARPGDVIAAASGPGQLHLMIATDMGFVHADAGLRRVVERPGRAAMAGAGVLAGDQSNGRGYMATIVLTAVGTAIGGPIGGAVGAMVGQAIDRRLFAAKGREGPRLTELAVQTSSYGTAIPLLFGTMRVAGTVIWSTDLIEHAARAGGGKGQGGTTQYSYSASFAVALSGRRVRAVRRIWADGRLLRGTVGDLKVPVTFRLHDGGEDQAADPLIASAEGIDAAPAHRGIAYAVFENLALADYGNRIPSLTFEVVADDAPVTCGTIVGIVSDGAVAGAEAILPLAGYAAHGDSRRALVTALAGAGGAWFAKRGTTLALTGGTGAAAEIVDAGVGGGGRARRTIAPADTAPRTATVQHYDPARDYQTGLQSATRGTGLRTLRIDLPAAISADDARTMAQAMLVRADLARERRMVTLDWRGIGLTPGERVRIAGETGQWRVAGWSLEGMALTLTLARVAAATVPAHAAPGRVLAAPDLLAGATRLHAFEIPPLDDRVPSAPQLTIAAAGSGAGWRQAALSVGIAGGWTGVTTRRLPAIVGRTEGAVAAGSAYLIDRRTTIVVALAHAGMMLADADAAGIDAGANRALIGDEIVQFERAVPLGAARWRLSGLWRGRRGTEAAAGLAAAGSRFVLLDPATLHVVDLPHSAIGTDVAVMAAGIGDAATGVTVHAPVDGRSVAPPSPVHVRAVAGTLHWIRRGRAGWPWRDGADVPLTEEREHYRIARADGSVILETTGPSVALPGGPAGDWSIRQIGTLAASAPTMVRLF